MYSKAFRIHKIIWQNVVQMIFLQKEYTTLYAICLSVLMDKTEETLDVDSALNAPHSTTSD